MTGKSLKLLARDAEDLEVISALLQDAITPVCDVSYQPDKKIFIMVVNRFCWDEANQLKERVRCAVSVTGVSSVGLHGIDLTERGKILELLAILLEGDAMQLIFAGGAGIKLSLEKWEMKIGDFGEPWPTFHQPVHNL